jgi:hypothetical protein
MFTGDSVGNGMTQVEFVKQLIMGFCQIKDRDLLPYDPSVRDTNAVQHSHNQLYRHAAEVFAHTMRATCQNDSRRRRLYARFAADWDQMQLQTESMESTHHASNGKRKQTTLPFYMSSWMLDMKLYLMADMLLQGFALELYHPRELCSVYWYTSRVLENRLSNMTRIQSFVKTNAVAWKATERSWLIATRHMCYGLFVVWCVDSVITCISFSLRCKRSGCGTFRPPSTANLGSATWDGSGHSRRSSHRISIPTKSTIK